MIKTSPAEYVSASVLLLLVRKPLDLPTQDAFFLIRTYNKWTGNNTFFFFLGVESCDLGKDVLETPLSSIQALG